MVAMLIGRAVDPEQPLMEAGLDSLGDCSCFETRKFIANCPLKHT